MATDSVPSSALMIPELEPLALYLGAKGSSLVRFFPNKIVIIAVSRAEIYL